MTMYNNDYKTDGSVLSFLITRRAKYRLIPCCTFRTQPFPAIGTLGYRRFLGMIKTIHRIINYRVQKYDFPLS